MEESKNITSSLLTPERLWAAICGVTGFAAAIFCKKYGSQLSTPLIVIICLIPILLCIFFVWHFGKNREKLKKNFKYLSLGILIVLILYYVIITLPLLFKSRFQGNIEMENQVNKSLSVNSRQAAFANTKKQINKRKEYSQKEAKINENPSLEDKLSTISSINSSHLPSEISVGNTQSCIDSNCVRGNNYGKMEINKYGAAKLLMTDDQELAIIKAMMLYPGVKFKIMRNQATPDSYNYAEKLKNALLDAGMVCVEDGKNVTIIGQPIPSGISMSVGSDEVYIMNALKAALEETGLPQELVSANPREISSDILEIIITPSR